MNTDGKICNNCQYFRDPKVMKPETLKSASSVPDGSAQREFWCSNSKSEYFMKIVGATDSCSEFYKKGQKAPLGMRAAIKAVSAVKKLKRKR